MDGTTIVAVLTAVGASFGFQVFLSHRKKRQDQINDLQLYDDEAGQVHFPSMLFQTDITIGYGDHRPSDLYQVQRLGDGTWQKCATGTTVYRWYCRDCVLDERKHDRKAWDIENQHRIGWQPMLWPELETAYQRFIHAPPTLQVYPKLRMLWEEEDEKTAEEAKVSRSQLTDTRAKADS